MDFQLPHYNSGGCDLTAIIHTCVDPLVRRDERNFDEMVKTYHEGLVRTLDKFNYGGRKPDLDEIRTDMEKFSFFALTVTLICSSLVICGDKFQECFDVEKIIATGGKEGIDLSLFDSPIIVKYLGPDLEKFIERFS